MKILSFVLLTITTSTGMFSHLPATADEKELKIPDFTRGDKIPAEAKHDWNLGPTGLRAGCFATNS